MAESKRQRLEQLRTQLENERSSFVPHWKEIADFVLPRRPRFFIQDINRGDRRSQKIIDSSASLAVRTLRAGMMGGVTSPARPWFRLTTPDPELAEYGSVKQWLFDVQQRMSTVFLRSNVYNILPIMYGDLGTFGTAPISLEEDFETVIRSYSFPVGSYMIANDEKLRVRVFMRDFRMTVRQVVEQFGRTNESGSVDWSNISDQVKRYWDEGFYEEWIDIVHAVTPNADYDQNKKMGKNKKFYACYYERGMVGGQQYLQPGYDRLLEESGYDLFPILCPRWEVSGEDTYAVDCPGMLALGDIKQLQLGERRGMQAIEKMVNPPMVAPSTMRNQAITILPGGISYQDTREGTQGLRPAHEVQFKIEALEGKQAQVRDRIRRAFFEDLFLMLASSDRREITAREIDERHEEKLLALGPVLEQLNQDLLDPLIDNTFTIMDRQGLLPPPPNELQGVKLRVEYVSVMAQAQKLLGLSGIERFTAFAGQVAAASPQVLDKINTDQLIDVYGDITSIAPGIIRTDDEVADLRAERNKQMQAQKMAEAMPQMASSAKDLSETSLEGNSALSSLLQQSKAGALT